MQATNIKQLYVSSPSFAHEEHIPEKFTCDDLNISPGLEIRGIPADARSLAIVMEDPDAPGKVFDHWLVWNIPPTESIPENSQSGLEGLNSSGKIGYMGPCPPSGTHRYFFKVFAVDTLLETEKGADKTKLEYVLKDHILAYGELIGLYSSKKNKG
jgi:Raf kinase inhibitor-like YbhB/YbcL family protein